MFNFRNRLESVLSSGSRDLRRPVLGKGNELTIQIGHLAPIWCRSNRGMMVAGVQ